MQNSGYGRDLGSTIFFFIKTIINKVIFLDNTVFYYKLIYDLLYLFRKIHKNMHLAIKKTCQFFLTPF